MFKNPKLSMSSLTLVVTLLVSVIFATWLSLAYESTDKLSKLWNDSLVRAEVLHDHTYEIVSHLGYGGLIHDFKNYVIRKDQASYEALVNDFDEFDAKLDQIELELKSAEEFRAIHSLRTVINHYRANLDVVHQMVVDGIETSEIDQRVRIDDTVAKESLALLRQLSAEKRVSIIETTGKQLARTQSVIASGLVLLIPLIASGFLLSLILKRLNNHLNISARQTEDLEALLNGSLSAVLAVDDRGLILSANQFAEEMTGYVSSDLLGMPIDMLVPEALRDRHRTLFAEFIERPSVKVMAEGRNIQLQTKAGVLIRVEIRLTPISVRNKLQIVVTMARRDLIQSWRGGKVVNIQSS